jgi:hypothetical protein
MTFHGTTYTVWNFVKITGTEFGFQRLEPGVKRPELLIVSRTLNPGLEQGISEVRPKIFQICFYRKYMS